MIPRSVSPDGQRLMISAFRDSTFWDLLEMDLATGSVHDFIATEGIQTNGNYSPDGKWVAYVQENSGFLRTLRVADAAAPQRSIPIVDDIDVGVTFCWAPNSDAIVMRHKEAFRRFPLQIEGSRIRVGSPQILQRENFVPGSDFQTADIQADLSRAVVMVPAGDNGKSRDGSYDILVTNWFQDLEERVPSKAP